MPTGTELLNRAQDGWDEILRAHADLRPAVDLQVALITTIIDELSRLERSAEDRVRLDAGVAAARMRRDQPAFESPVQILPAAELTSAVTKLCSHLAAGGAASAQGIGKDIAAGRLNAVSLVAASLGRDQERIHAAACQLGVAPDLLWLVAELAAGPIAFLFQRDLIRSSAEVATLASEWPHGFCPICGSWPALAEVNGGARVLRCSFCAAAWGPRENRCVYCGESGEAFAVTTLDHTGSDRRLELCGSCRGYLKAVPADTPTPFPLLAVEDLASLDLDLAAAERGFVRPPMLRFGAAD